jgi:hypothetical protein
MPDTFVNANAYSYVIRSFISMKDSLLAGVTQWYYSEEVHRSHELDLLTMNNTAHAWKILCRSDADAVRVCIGLRESIRGYCSRSSTGSTGAVVLEGPSEWFKGIWLRVASADILIQVDTPGSLSDRAKDWGVIPSGGTYTAETLPMSLKWVACERGVGKDLFLIKFLQSLGLRLPLMEFYAQYQEGPYTGHGKVLSLPEVPYHSFINVLRASLCRDARSRAYLTLDRLSDIANLLRDHELFSLDFFGINPDMSLREGYDPVMDSPFGKALLLNFKAKMDVGLKVGNNTGTGEKRQADLFRMYGALAAYNPSYIVSHVAEFRNTVSTLRHRVSLEKALEVVPLSLPEVLSIGSVPAGTQPQMTNWKMQVMSGELP